MMRRTIIKERIAVEALTIARYLIRDQILLNSYNKMVA